MQEKFAIRNTLRKVAALGTSLAMVGITVSGALAAGLGDYPGGYSFTKNRSSTVVVYGADSDMDAANDAAVGLPGAASSSTDTPIISTVSGVQYGVASLGTMSYEDLFLAGSEKDLDLGDPINDTTNFGNKVEDTKLSTLKDSTVSISIGSTSGTYDYHEEIRFGRDTGTAGANEPSPSFIGNPITAETGLTGADFAGTSTVSQDEKWKENVFLSMPDGSLGYYYVFDEALKQGNYLSNSTTTEPVSVNFLGQDLEIQAATSTSVTVNVGKTLRIKAGETATVDTGSETVSVTLIGVSSTPQAELKIEGPGGSRTEVIDNSVTRSFTGITSRPIQIRVEDAFNDDGIQYDSATIIVGLCPVVDTQNEACEARSTKNDGENYAGEDNNDPIWEWDLAGLTTGTSTSIRLGARLSLGLDNPSEEDNPLVKHPLYAGDYLCLPNFYACVLFEKMTESDDDFQAYEISDTTKDLYSTSTDTTTLHSNARVLQFRAKGANDQGIIATDGSDTDTMFLYVNNSGFSLFREQQSGSKALYAGGNHSQTDTEQNLAAVLNNAFQLDHGSTSINVDVLFSLSNTSTAAGVFVIDSPGNLTGPYTSLKVNPTAAFAGNLPFNATGLTTYTLGARGLGQHLNDGDIVIYFENSSINQLTYLGHSDSDTVTANDLLYIDGSVVDGAAKNFKDISNWEENTRTKDGTIIYDPDASNSGDKVSFAVSSDINSYEAKIRVTSPKEGVVSTGPGSSGVASSSVVVKDSDVLSTYTGLNVVAVGGPCVNQVTAALLGVTFPACGEASGLTEGVSTLALTGNGAKKALLVYGWGADDTRRAAVLAKNPTELKAKLTEAGKLSADSVTVRGVGLEVSGLSVA